MRCHGTDGMLLSAAVIPLDAEVEVKNALSAPLLLAKEKFCRNVSFDSMVATFINIIVGIFRSVKRVSSEHLHG